MILMDMVTWFFPKLGQKPMEGERAIWSCRSCETHFFFLVITPWKFAILKGKACLPSIHFQGRAVKLRVYFGGQREFLGWTFFCKPRESDFPLQKWLVSHFEDPTKTPLQNTGSIKPLQIGSGPCWFLGYFFKTWLWEIMFGVSQVDNGLSGSVFFLYSSQKQQQLG